MVGEAGAPAGVGEDGEAVGETSARQAASSVTTRAKAITIQTSFTGYKYHSTINNRLG
jgi:hypothetical protein